MYGFSQEQMIEGALFDSREGSFPIFPLEGAHQVQLIALDGYSRPVTKNARVIKEDPVAESICSSN